MKLLIVTQKIDKNDDILGFFHGWIQKFAEKVQSVIVVCLEKGEYDFPENVKVFSLGKEKLQNGYMAKWLYGLRFYKYIWSERKNYDTVFVHMNPEYVVLGGLFWKAWKKKVFLWFTHKSVNWKLRMAEKLVDKIFTASKKSCRLDSKKIVVTGHGIDVATFQSQSQKSKVKSQKFIILTVGRIAKVKNVDVLVKVAEILKNKNFDFKIKIAGTPALKKDKKYFEELKKHIKEKSLEDVFQFVGKISNKDIPDFYHTGDLFINLSDTGSLDKVILEAMASGFLVLTSNEAFREILEDKYFTSKKPLEISEKVMLLSKDKPDPALRDYIVQNHNLNKLIEKIIGYVY